jgi:kynurenine formamidase
MRVASPVLLLTSLLAACTPPSAEAPRPADLLSTGRWIDLSHEYSSETINWPTEPPFRLEVVAAGMTPGGWYYASNRFSTPEHGGTHLDAPVHFAEGMSTTDRVTLDRLTGPAVVVDVRARADSSADYLVGVADLEGWESRQGRIPDGAIVLLRTGWSTRWPDRARYLGTTKTGAAAVPELHFPGLDSAAAEWLVRQRRIDALGIDTPSIDRGQSRDFIAHRILMAADMPLFENVASLDSLPELGAYVVALPMKIRGGTGGPLRIAALAPR